ncbi:hypothetical protein ACFFMN_08545 [Planobispora siamensis]|uniref:Uncharacterized protein n=1 Tax=Planobispora siamensis TaxID=936338 RepID=A0A8J3WHG4_9ACTN|nr:hypothetical protein [Planobispora siamensis]GIH90544.1 hypothetical protein Psi01_11740 [Planobispora siamensis]
MWAAFDPESGPQIRARPPDGGTPSTLVRQAAGRASGTSIAGDDVAWSEETPEGELGLRLKRGDAAPVNLTADAGSHGYQASIKDGGLAFTRGRFEDESFHSAPVIYGLATGTRVELPEVPSTGPFPSDSRWPRLAGPYMLWLYDADGEGRSGVMRAALDGSGMTPIVRDGPEAPSASRLDASDQVATIIVEPPRDGTDGNEDLPKLFQVPVTGGELQRYSCNRDTSPCPPRARALAWSGSTAPPPTSTR